MPRAELQYNRNLLGAALDKWQALWVQMIDRSAGVAQMMRSHRVAVDHSDRSTLSAAFVEWKFTRRLVPFMHRRRVRHEIRADLHFQERVMRRSLRHIRTVASELRNHITDAISEVVRMKDGPMPVYLELASQKDVLDVSTLARRFTPGGAATDAHFSSVVSTTCDVSSQTQSNRRESAIMVGVRSVLVVSHSSTFSSLEDQAGSSESVSRAEQRET